MNKIDGLSKEQVKSRLNKFGYNEISNKQKSNLKRLFKKLWNPIPWMIELAALLSAILGKWDDFIIIIILLFINIFIDYKQESKALNTLEILKNKLAKKALVLREGKFKKIDARFLVPGDIIKLKIGDVVPADVKLIKGKYLEIDQSALTGESLPANKVVNDIVYSNSIVKIGEMLAEVTNTGEKTYFGKSISLVKQAQKENKSHFQKAIINISNFLILFTGVLAIIIIIISIYRHNNFFEVLQFVLILVIASIPVALPAVLSVTMAIGAISLAKRKAIVANLPAIEELAGIKVLCIDKTGTLTQNKMSVSQPITYSNFTEKDLFINAALASSQESKDPIEQPIFEYLKNNFSDNNINDFVQQEFTPFDPVIKRTEAVVSNNGKKIIITKGAPQIIISLCGDTKIKKQFFDDVQKFAEKGYRTLAVALKKEKQNNFECVGLIPLLDPPRKDSFEMIKKIKEMGIDIKMLTGDNHAIAVQIADILNIGTNIIDTSELKDNNPDNNFNILNEVINKGFSKKFKNKLSPDKIKKIGHYISKEIKSTLKGSIPSVKSIKKHEIEIIELIEGVNGFSQVMPEDKYFIVNELQKANNIVAMTGDGVNDVPALQKADIGVAVSGATDATRAASDLILLSPGLSIINHAIVIARQTFERMKYYAIFRIAETMRIILFMSLSIIVFNFYPITAIMIIILALLNDIPVMMIAYDNVPTSNEPVDWNMKEILIVASVLGLFGVASSFLLFYWLHAHNYPLALIQTLLFIKLDVAGHSTLYLTRTGRYHFWHKPFPSLKFFLPAFSSRIIGTLAAVYGIFMMPISWKYVGYIWVYAIIWWLLNDIIKVFTYKILNK